MPRRSCRRAAALRPPCRRTNRCRCPGFRRERRPRPNRPIRRRRPRTRCCPARWRRRCRRRRHPSSGPPRRWRRKWRPRRPGRRTGVRSTCQSSGPALLSGCGRPGPAAARRRAGPVAVVGLVVREERMNSLPAAGATVADRVAGVAVDVGQRGPVVLPDGVRLHEGEVPVLFGIPGHPIGQLRTVRGNADHPGQPLETGIGRPRRSAGSSRWSAWRPARKIGIDRVHERDAVRPIRMQVEFADGRGGQVRGHWLLGAPFPGGPAGPGAATDAERRWRPPGARPGR